MHFPKTRIHLDVRDAERSIAFYEALLAVGAERRGQRRAVFDLDSPPLVLVIDRHSQRSPEHRFELVVDDPRAIGATAIALRRAGVRLRLEDRGIQALDPDGNAWTVRLDPANAGRTVVPV